MATRTRKENFFISMKNNAEVKKRFGGNVQAAYDAMRRQSNRNDTNDPAKALARHSYNRVELEGSGPSKAAVDRRVAKSKNPDASSPYRKWSTSGKKFQPDTTKSVYREYVSKQHKQGKTPLFPDDLLHHKSRQAHYKDNERIAKNKKKAATQGSIARRLATGRRSGV